MYYDFKVKPETYKVFVEEATDREINELENEFKSFRVSYNTEPNYKADSIFGMLDGTSDNQQIIMWGIKEDNNKVSIAYWLVGDGAFEEDEEDYKNALKAFEIIQKEYKIED